MTPDRDDELRRHFEPARRAELPAGSFERLVDRLDAPLPAIRARRVPKLLALAAVLLLVVGVSAVVAASQGDRGQDVRSLDDPTSTTQPSTTSTTEHESRATTTEKPAKTTTTTASTTTTTTTAPPPVQDGRPATIAAVVDPDGDGSGSLVVLDGYTGKVIRTLREDGASDVDVAPDGTIYVQSAPPAGSEYETTITAVDPVTGATGTSYPSSQRPSVSPDGRRLARGQPGTVVAETLPSGPAQILVGIEVGPDRGGQNHVLGDLAWSRDGALVAVGQIDQQVYGTRQPPVPMVVIIDPSKSLEDPEGYVFVDVEGAASPVFPADGSLLVIAGATGPASGTSVTGDRLAAWDPDTNQVTGEVAVPHVSALDASADGRWVIATRAGLRPRLVMKPGAVGDLGELPQAPEGIIAAAW